MGGGGGRGEEEGVYCRGFFVVVAIVACLLDLLVYMFVCICHVLC